MSLILFFVFSCKHTLQKNHIVKEENSLNQAFECSNLAYRSIQERANFLIESFNKMKPIETQEQQQLDKLYFCAFPSNFKEMEQMFGFYDKTGPGPLYYAPHGENIINYFKQLTSIPKEEYYNKYIDICINGVWQADNIRKSFGFGNKLRDDTKAVCSQLSKRTDEEIKSVFHFVLDGLHPGNGSLERLYKILFPKIAEQDDRLKQIFEQAYKETLIKYGDY